jgi:hypothetical protein
MPECEKCNFEARIIALEKDSERNSKQHKEYYDLFKSAEVKQAVTDTTYSQILEKLAALSTKVDELLNKPSKRWETVIASIISVAVGACVAYFLKG